MALRSLLLALLLALATIVTLTSTADARARCGAYTTREYRAEIDPATAIFVGDLIEAVPRDDLDGQSGVPGADLTFRVRVAIRGVAVGDTVVVYWRGFAEPPGMRVGGCRVPALEARMSPRHLVIAQGPPSALTVPNQTTSRRVGRADALVQRVRRIASTSARRAQRAEGATGE